jgi:hypothetical protein
VTMYEVTDTPTLNPGDSDYVSSGESLWFKQDDLVVDLASLASDGSLSGTQPFTAIHPHYLDDLFGQRIGIQLGANHDLPSVPSPPLMVVGVYVQPSLIQIDGEIPSLRPQQEQTTPTLQPADPTQQALLIVRTVISGTKGAADTDGLLRFSMGSIELVAGGGVEAGLGVAEYHPIATLDRRGIAVASRVDDFLFASLAGPRTVDFVFVVDKDKVFGPGTKDPPYHIMDGTFLEMKRYAVVDLSGKRVEYGPPTNRDKVGLVRKPDIERALVSLGTQQLAGVAPPTPPQPGASMGDLGLIYQGISISYDLFTPLDVRKPGANGSVQLANGLSGTWASGGWRSLSIPIAEQAGVLAAPGTNTISRFEVRDEDVLVQVHMTIPPTFTGKRAWQWAGQLSNLAMSDMAENTYKPIGAWVRATSKGADYIVASFNNGSGAFNPIEQQITRDKPVEVWVAFYIPKNTKLDELQLNGTAILEDLGFKAVEPPASQPSTVGLADRVSFPLAPGAAGR